MPEGKKPCFSAGLPEVGHFGEARELAARHDLGSIELAPTMGARQRAHPWSASGVATAHLERCRHTGRFSQRNDCAGPARASLHTRPRQTSRVRIRQWRFFRRCLGTHEDNLGLEAAEGKPGA